MLSRGHAAWHRPVRVDVLPGAVLAVTLHADGGDITLPFGLPLRLTTTAGHVHTVTDPAAALRVADVIEAQWDATGVPAERPSMVGEAVPDDDAVPDHGADPENTGPGRPARHAAPMPPDRGDDPDLTITAASLADTSTGRHRGLAPAAVPAPAPAAASAPVPATLSPAARVVPASPEVPDDATVVGLLQRSPSTGATGAAGPVPRGADSVPDVEDARRAAVVVQDAGGSRQEDLSVALVLGRAPDPSVAPVRPARPVPVTGDGDEVSQSHACLREQGGLVLVTDLYSTNGTRVMLPGQPPYRLRDGEEVPVPPGAVVDLGDGVSVSILGAGHGA